MAGPPVAYIDGLDELRRVLAKIDPAIKREIGKSNKKVADVYADQARRKVPTGRASTRKLDQGIRARARQRDIAMAIRSTGRRPTIAAVLGANVHPVFGRRYPMSVLSRPVWQPHLGNRWKPEQLYGIGPVFDGVPNEVAELWFDAIREALEGFAE